MQTCFGASEHTFPPSNLQTSSVLSLQFLVGMVVTILTDIIHIAIFYPLSSHAGGGDLFRFSAGMAILSLLLKPVSCFFVWQMYRERGGDYNVNFGRFFGLSFADSSIKVACPAVWNVYSEN